FSLFRAPAPTAPYTLSLHDALPISGAEAAHRTAGGGHAGLSLRALRLRRTLAPLAVPELQELGHGQADPRRCRRIAMAALPATPVLAAWLFGAAVASALGTALMLGYGRRRLLDQPGQRRSHATPTPRGGGLGPVLAWCAALFALAGAGAGGTQALLLAIGTLAVAAIGLVDD